jgi:hypothetical protein
MRNGPDEGAPARVYRVCESGCREARPGPIPPIAKDRLKAPRSGEVCPTIDFRMGWSHVPLNRQRSGDRSSKCSAGGFAPDANNPGTESPPGRPPGALAQGLVDPLPAQARRAAEDGRQVTGRPAAGGGVVGVGPGEDERGGQARVCAGSGAHGGGRGWAGQWVPGGSKPLGRRAAARGLVLQRLSGTRPHHPRRAGGGGQTKRPPAVTRRGHGVKSLTPRRQGCQHGRVRYPGHWPRRGDGVAEAGPFTG